MLLIGIGIEEEGGVSLLLISWLTDSAFPIL